MASAWSCARQANTHCGPNLHPQLLALDVSLQRLSLHEPRTHSQPSPIARTATDLESLLALQPSPLDEAYVLRFLWRDPLTGEPVEV